MCILVITYTYTFFFLNFEQKFPQQVKLFPNKISDFRIILLLDTEFKMNYYYRAKFIILQNNIRYVFFF